MIELNMIKFTSNGHKQVRFKPSPNESTFTIPEGEIVMLKDAYGKTLPLLACLGSGYTCPNCIFSALNNTDSGIAAKNFTTGCPHLMSSNITICDCIKGDNSYNIGYFTSVEDLI